MKRLFLTVALACVSQVFYGQTPSWGIKAGANLSSFKGDNDHLNPIAGFHAGVLAGFKLSEILSVQGELLYTTAGAKNTSHTAEGKFSETLRLGYVGMPVLLQYHPLKKLSIGLGAEARWLVSARVRYEEGSTVPIYPTCNGCIMDLMEKFSCGINGAVGYDLPMQFFVEARYHLGLTDVYKNNNAVSGTFRNSVFQLSLGYRL